MSPSELPASRPEREAPADAAAPPSGRRVRVLQVVLNLHQGGLERIVGDLVRRLDPSRFEVHVLALQFLGQLAEGLEDYAVLHVAPSQPRWSLLWPSTLAEAIRRIGPDVVHTHSGVWYKASLAARMAGVPFLVHTDHGRQSPDPFTHRFLDRLASARTDVVIAVSDVLGKQLATTVVRYPERIQVVRNGVDTTSFAPRTDATLREELGIAADVPIIGSIGRLDPIKCFDIMIEALALVREGWTRPSPAPVLVIAGDGPDRERIEQRIRERALERFVHLVGWREDVHALHAAFTIFSMSSRSEGTSIGLLEAMSAELCPVVTAVGGNPAVLGPALQHRLCAPENPVALANAWTDALSDDTHRRRDGRAARQRVDDAFSLRAMVAAHEAIYLRGAGPDREAVASNDEGQA